MRFILSPKHPTRYPMTDSHSTTDRETPLWEVVALSDVEFPAVPASVAATKGIARFLRRFRPNKAADQPPKRAEADLQALSDARRDRLVPPIRWDAAARALSNRLGAWPSSGASHQPIRFYIGPPFSGIAETLDVWARSSGWPRVEPPTPDQILAGDETWITAVADAAPSGGWVLPHLEHCYLRHPDGLQGVRRFLARAVSGELGPGLIGCDSWAWVFLQKVWPVPHPEAMAPQAFSGERLARLFRRSLQDAAKTPVRVRHSVTGEDVLPTLSPDDSDSEDVSSEMKRLAYDSLGNPGIAQAYWRSRLRTAPDDPKAETSPSKETGEPGEPECLWLSPELNAPVMPSPTGEEADLVLHALLLHNGLSASLLAELLPLSHPTVVSVLLNLAAHGIVERRGNVFRVTTYGYIPVRVHLRDRDYLTAYAYG